MVGDDAAPVQAVGKIIHLAVHVTIRNHVMWLVLVLCLYGLHVGRHLERQEALRLKASRNDIELCFVLHAEAQQDGVG